MIPLLVDLSGKKVIVFGGGEVGARKAAYFAPEADVRIYSRSFSPEAAGLPVERHILELEECNDDQMRAFLAGAFLVVAATRDSALNNRIGRICRTEGILFNNAEGDAGDLLIPSVIEGERFLVAVSTRGFSPAVSRFLREFLEAQLPDLDLMIGLQERLRTYLRDCEPDQRSRRDIMWNVLRDRDVWSALREGELSAWTLISRRYLE